MSTRIRRLRRGFAAAGGASTFALTLLLLVAGCSGAGSKDVADKGGSPSGSNGATTSATGNERDQAYTACLTQHGVTLPTFSGRAFPSGSFSRRPRPTGSFVRPTGSFSRPPGGFGGGFLGSATADPSTPAARQACASLRPTGGFGRNGGSGGGQGAISATTFAAFTSCMSDNGVTITSSDPAAALRALNRADPKTAAALKVCQPILGSAAARGSAPASSAPTPSD